MSTTSAAAAFGEAVAEGINDARAVTLDRSYRPLSSSATTRTADVVIVGTTPGGIAAFYEASKRGLTVELLDDWRGTPIGGMMAGGLGGTDADTLNAYGGLARKVLRDINIAQGRPEDTKFFQPRYARQVFLTMLAAYGGTVRTTGGIRRVRMDGTTITAVETMNGEVYEGTYFIDATYEGDLLMKAGCSYRVGREAAQAGSSLNGYRGFITSSGGSNHQFKTPAGVALSVDPFVTEGDPRTGPLPFVNPRPNLAEGAADERVQAFNFRMVTTTGGDKVAMPSTAPDGFDASQVEIFLRYLKALTDAGLNSSTLTLDHFLIFNSCGGGVYDLNSKNGYSTDFFGGSWHYTRGSNAQREAIWKEHERHIRGFFYTLQYLSDSRVPSWLRTEALTWGFDGNHYADQSAGGSSHPNDALYWPSQLYVREGARLVGDYVMIGSDIVHTDGTTPRSTNTIAAGSYQLDSHSTQWIYDHRGTGWWIRCEGGFEANAGGTDKIFPIPIEAILPKRAECTNLMVTFCLSANHQAFGATRMELTGLAVGEAAATICAVALDGGGTPPALHDVPYADIRSAILADGYAVTPVLPQVN